MSRQTSTPVVHLELHTGDSAAARAFYGELCGWQPEHVQAAGRSYLALDLAHGLGGGIVECTTERSMWLPYVEVDDIHAATELARAIGAADPARAPRGPGRLAQRRGDARRRRDRLLAAEALRRNGHGLDRSYADCIFNQSVYQPCR